MLRTALAAGIASVVATSVAVVLVLPEAHEQSINEACERREAIVEGFDAYTDALIAAGAGQPRTPEEQAAYDERVAAFRADLDARLAPLEPTDC